MDTVTSTDGTTIAYERDGTGPTIVFVSGAFNDRTKCAAVAERLRDRYTVVCVDRRGRGDSTDAIAPEDASSYEPQREIDDLDAVIAATGGRAAVFGFSSGAILALQAAVARSAISHLMLYEAPFAIGGLAGTARPGLPERLAEHIANGKAGDAVAAMQIDGIGIPPEQVEQFRQSPMWPQLKKIAQTVVYDATICAAPNLPTEAMRKLNLPTLVLAGSESWPGLREVSATLPEHLRRARYVEVPGGAGHGIPAEATADAIDAFLRE